TAKALPDTEIAIKDASTGKVVFTGKTDKDGKLTVKLPVGKYTYQEVTAPANYTLDKTAHAFEIKADGEIVKAIMKDKLLLGALEIVKTMDGKKDGQLGGIQFRVTGKEANGALYNQTFTTDTHGKIEVKNLPVGTYTIHELEGKINKGYVLAADKTVSVKANLIASVKIDNQKVKATTVTKIPTAPKTPKTGQNPAIPYLVSFALLGAAGAMIFVTRKHSKISKK
ncbi:MAG TPA: hypothetical protein DEP60_09295, partial [Ruminococcaceae bacterium]|nr:hypothetical protein [Oscillospiraceae bacterium]